MVSRINARSAPSVMSWARAPAHPECARSREPNRYAFGSGPVLSYNSSVLSHNIERRMRRVAGLAGVIALLVLLVFGNVSSYEQDVGLSHQQTSLFGSPVENLSPSGRRDFYSGFELFARLWTPEDGLGPHFNAKSCASCHAEPVVGGSGTTTETLVMLRPPSATIATESVFPRFELTPHGNTILRATPDSVLFRRTPALFGLGLLESVSVGTLREYADPTDLDSDRISGRIAGDPSNYGRFGWTAVAGTIEEFVASAFCSELGLVGPAGSQSLDFQQTVEIDENSIGRVAQYIRLLAPPPSRSSALVLERQGRKVFQEVGCEACHRSTLRTQSSEVAVLSERVFYPYTDLLLHDMGPGMGPLVVSGGATPREYRTPPLWGLSSTGPPYMHDGSAGSVAEAIEAHDGEALESLEAYSALAVRDLRALVAFLESL